MNELVLGALLTALLPLALTIVALTLRMQSELCLNQRRGYHLRIASTGVFTILALVCLVFGNIFGLVLGMLIVGRWIQFQISQNSVNQQTAELELIWLLALATKSERSLVEEVESYALSAAGPRQRRLLAFVDDLQYGAPVQTCLPYELFSRPTALELQSAMNSAAPAAALTRLAISRAHALGEQNDELGSSVLAYPLGLMMMLVACCGFVMYYIIPKYKKIFEDFGTELPATTIAAIYASDFIVNYWYVIVAPIITVLVLIRKHLVNVAHSGEAAAAIEILGRFSVRFHAPEVLRSLATAISSGQPMTDAINVFAQQPGPRLFQSTIETFIRRVQHGEAAWDELRVLGILRGSEQRVIESAARAGNLPWVLETLADSLERRWRFRFSVIGAVLRPPLILLICIPIGYFAIAIFMPLIKLLHELSLETYCRL